MSFSGDGLSFRGIVGDDDGYKTIGRTKIF